MELHHDLILNKIKIEQRALLDKLEFAYATRPEEWRLLRSAILKAFGGDGLSGFVLHLKQETQSKNK